MADALTLAQIREAASRIQSYIHRTPVMTSGALDGMAGCELFFKCENFQKIGAFKIRGATNAILKLDTDAMTRGVATHSSGNHGAAVALAAASRGADAIVVMPEDAPAIKKQAVAGYGARIVFCDRNPRAREERLSELLAETGASFIHPYDHPDVIEGQATVALEFLDAISDLDLILTPIGGGGLISGTAMTVRALSPSTRIIGVEPIGANAAYRSFREGTLMRAEQPASIADGLLASLSERTYDIISQYVDDVVTVEDVQIVQAMRTVWERMKLVIEPSAAVPLAAVLADKVNCRDQRVGIVVSGGNVDLDSLPW